MRACLYSTWRAATAQHIHHACCKRQALSHTKSNRNHHKQSRYYASSVSSSSSPHFPIQSSADIRSSFLSFFQSNDHLVVPSSSLIPSNDPSLLFTSAGMVPYKAYYLSLSSPPHPRLTSCQRCLRVGGKHNDLNEVGRSNRHHTFFEMLGNFSFHDYDKYKACNLAWNYITNILKLPADRLRITVYENDRETLEIWKSITGWSYNNNKDDRILLMGSSDNYWSMGDEGPAGPCTEIYYNRSTNNNQPDQYIEIWNIVFMTEQKYADGTIKPLSRLCVDTGMGLERLAAVLQGQQTNYDIDTFKPIIQAAKELVQQHHQDNTTTTTTTSQLSLLSPPSFSSSAAISFLDDWTGSSSHPLSSSFIVLLDHLRAICFLYLDGLLPSNYGRGYVLRRLIRRALTHAYMLGIKSPCLYSLYPALESSMGSAYPELSQHKHHVMLLIEEEEKLFFVTLEKGLRVLQDEMKKQIKRDGNSNSHSNSNSTANQLNGEAAFLLYDSYGFPLDLTELIIARQGWSVDHQRFNSLMQQQRDTSRAHWAGSGDQHDKIPTEIRRWQQNNEIRNRFSGYETTHEGQAKVLAISAGLFLFNDRATNTPNIFSYVVIDPCPFYAAGGGQINDEGWLIPNADNVINSPQDRYPVVDVIKLSDQLIVLKLEGDISNIVKEGSTVTAIVSEHRHQTAIHHTSTHLLHAALRKHLQSEGRPITQAGSFVSAEYLRFDFSYPKPISTQVLTQIQDTVNTWAKAALPVEHKITSKKEADMEGAIGLFTDKYGEQVRIISIPSISSELCGGTHVINTSMCYPFLIIGDTSIAAGIRRIEAVAGQQCISRLMSAWYQQQQLSDELKVPPSDILIAIKKIKQQLNKKHIEIKQLQKQLVGKRAWPIQYGQYISSDGIIVPIVLHLIPFNDTADVTSLRGDALVLHRNAPQSLTMLLCPDNGICYIAVDPKLVHINSRDVWERLRIGLLSKGGIGGKGGGNAALMQGMLPILSSPDIMVKEVRLILNQTGQQQNLHQSMSS